MPIVKFFGSSSSSSVKVFIDSLYPDYVYHLTYKPLDDDVNKNEVKESE
jgi:hypothetical protein